MANSIHSDTRNALRVGGRRFERSPFFGCHSNEDMLFSVYAGRFFTIANGEDPEAKYWTLRRKALIYDVPERPVEISGPDAVPFMEKVFARHIAGLKQGRGRYAIACAHHGGTFMDGLLFRLTDDRFWYVQPDGALETWLLAHSEGFDVTVSDPHSRVLQIQGPNSLEIMRDASDGAIDESMGYFHAGFFDLGGQELYVSRTGWTAELGYEVYTQGDATDCPRLWDHLIAAGKPHGMEYSSANSMEIRRIEGGILDNITDFDLTMTPFQAGLEAFIDMDQERFIGRAALIDADRRTLLYGLKCKDLTPDTGDAVLDGGIVVGSMTNGTRSPYLECGIGYVRFAEPGEWAGRNLTIRSRDGTTAACEIVDLPFYDPEKRIPRRLDTSIP
jgi:glycine cleavage system aminomethyltransferase T